MKQVVIVNACTGTKDNPHKPLCCKVCKSIENILPGKEGYPDNFYHIHHTVSWNCNNRSRLETFGKTDKTAVKVNDNIDKNGTFDCQNNKYWKKYLHTTCLSTSCYGKLKIK